MIILRKKIIFVLFVISFLICQPRVINAVEESIIFKNEAINPGSFYYSFKRLFEKGQEKLLFFQQSKKSFYESLVKMRLSELNYVIDKKALSEVQRSSERFSYQAGILTQELVKQSNSDEKTKLLKEFEKYGKFLANLRDKFPANSSYWMLIQHDINTLTILAERLK